MSKVGVLASVFALAVGTVGCGNSRGQSNSLVDVGPSAVASVSADADTGNLATLGKPSGGGGKNRGGGGTTTGGGGTLSLVMLVDSNGDGGPNYNDTITFNVSTTATSSPFVAVDCYQGSTWVYTASVGYFAAYPWAKQFILAANSWPGGAADCTARLYSTVDGTSTTTLATLGFHANP